MVPDSHSLMASRDAKLFLLRSAAGDVVVDEDLVPAVVGGAADDGPAAGSALMPGTGRAGDACAASL